MSPGPEETEGEAKSIKTPPPQILLPLEERVTHFRDMLLERGVRTRHTQWLSPEPVTEARSPRPGDTLLPELPGCG